MDIPRLDTLPSEILQKIIFDCLRFIYKPRTDANAFHAADATVFYSANGGFDTDEGKIGEHRFSSCKKQCDLYSLEAKSVVLELGRTMRYLCSINTIIRVNMPVALRLYYNDLHSDYDETVQYYKEAFKQWREGKVSEIGHTRGMIWGKIRGAHRLTPEAILICAAYHKPMHDLCTIALELKSSTQRLCGQEALLGWLEFQILPFMSAGDISGPEVGSELTDIRQQHWLCNAAAPEIRWIREQLGYSKGW